MKPTALCAEAHLERQRGLLTPNGRFYLRSNFPVPPGPAGFELAGAVRRPLRLAAGELAGLASRTLVVTTECAGNGRAFLDPPVAGEQWELGAVSTAEWTGVPLAAVLERVGMGPDVVEVVFEGADGFVRSLPVAVARHPDTLLATAMNGKAIPAKHGGPVRLVVPRWYGMASVKWLARVTAATAPFTGHFQTERYVIRGRPVREMAVRAVITSPAAGSRVASGPVRVTGYAWSGRGGIASVEISADGGHRWSPAELVASAPPYGWTRWVATWRPGRSGPAALLARATDSAGQVQPVTQQWNLLGYANNAAVPHRLLVVTAPSYRRLTRKRRALTSRSSTRTLNT